MGNTNWLEHVDVDDVDEHVEVYIWKKKTVPKYESWCGVAT